MNKTQLIEYHLEACQRMHDTLKAKNADYTGGSDNPFSNFTSVEDLGICSTEQGFLTRMTDKFKRLCSFVKKGMLSVKDESIEDTLFDFANYCILLAAYIKHKREAQ